MIQEYIREFKYTKRYFISIPVVILASYSIYLYCSDPVIEGLGREDCFFENLTAVCFLFASVLFFLSYRKKRIFLILLGLLLFFGAGEEISWGQRIFDLKTPAALEKINVQKEITIHNIEAFNSMRFNGTAKKGWDRFLEINFLFRLFCFLYGFLLPICVYHIRIIKNITRTIKLPVPPLSIGVFFIAAWLAKQLMLSVLPPGHNPHYYSTVVETYEFLSSYVFLIISIYFFNKRKEDILGLDIKQYI
jgi:hypothetical protein